VALNTAAPTFVFVIIALAILARLAIWLSNKRTRLAIHLPECQGSTTSPSCLQATELWFGTSEQRRAIEFYPLIGRDLPPGKRRLDPSRLGLSKLGPALQSVVSLLPAARSGIGDYMRVVVHGPLEMAGDGQSFFPFARGPDGKISSLARLYDDHGFDQIMGAAMVWQVASVIVAQKHLADISMKLSEIQRGINEIKDFLEAERVTKISSKLSYLKEVHQAIMQGDIPDAAVRNELERAEVELLQIQQHLTEDLQNLAEGIPRIEHSDWVGTKEFARNIEGNQRRLYAAHRQWILCVSARAAIWQVWSAFPGEDQRKVIRKEAILTSIDGFARFLPDAESKMQGKISEVKSLFNSLRGKEALDAERQSRLKERLARDQTDIASSIEGIRAEVLKLADRSFHQKSVVLALRVARGTVLEAYELDPD
jgi:hypothetical protein